MISQVSVMEKIDLADTIFNRCFDCLLAMKHGDTNIGNKLLRFQPELAECLYDLMTFYQDLKSEENKMIISKSSYSFDDFRGTMAEIHKFLNVIKEVIEIGKSLGDAFAWFFYGNNLPELGKHFRHESTGLFVAGIGGRGEIEFIKNNQNLQGLFVVYHSITSMLRVGDFSLYAPGAGIIGIGELKTEQDPSNAHKLTVNAHISSKIDLSATEITSASNETNTLHVEPRTQIPHKNPRLAKQLNVQDRLLYKKETNKTINQYTDYDYYLINLIANGNTIVTNQEKTLLLFSIQSRFSRLSECLLKDDYDFNPSIELKTAVDNLVLPNNDNNSLIYGNIDTVMTYARIPIFWWNIDDVICRDIYFKRVHILSAYNPAALFQHYVNAGFSLVSAKHINDFCLIKSQNASKIELGNLGMFFDLALHSLMKTSAIIKMIDSILSEIQNGNIPINTKIEMMIQLHTFGKPS